MTSGITFLNRRLGKSLGFFRTSEGREFLKFCYKLYLDSIKVRAGSNVIRHGKVAVAIAAKNASQQEKEDAKAIAALRRWVEGGQSELWRDQKKNLSAMEKLEIFLMGDPDIAQVMGDRAAENSRLNFLSALNLFFNTTDSKYSYAVLREKLSNYVGVFSISVEYQERHERYNPYFYSSDNYFRAELHESYPVLSIQEFCIQNRHGSRAILERRAGFACISESGEVFRFMISHVNPMARWIEIMKPQELPANAPHLSARDLIYYVSIVPVDNLGGRAVDNHRKTMVSGIYPLDSQSIMVNVAYEAIKDYVNSNISGVQWDIIL